MRIKRKNHLRKNLLKRRLVNKMIDAHAHLGSLPQGGINWGKFEEYQEISKKLNINNYCITPIGMPENFSKNTTPNNNSVLSEADKDKKIIPIYWFNVFDLPKTINGKYKAIKFHPDIGKINLNDKRVVDFVNKINLPIFVHTNEGKDYSNLEKASELAKQVKVPVIAVHSGSITRTFFNLDNYEFPENFYFEISGIQYALILKKIYKRFGAGKIILGSDYPFGDIRVSLAMIETLGLNKKEYEKITERNIKNILKL